MSRHIASMLLFLLLGFSAAFSQEPSRLSAYQDAVGPRSILYRGKQAERYDFLANGNPYWESPSFWTADIVVDGLLYEDVQVNIDAFVRRALVRVPGTPISITLTPAQVQRIESADRLFLGISNEGRLPEGFYEVIGDGSCKLYRRVEKRLDTSTANVNGAAIGYTDPAYMEDVSRYFAIRNLYYFQDASGDFSRIKGRAALLRKFPDRRKDIRRGISQAGLDKPGTGFDLWCRAVMKMAAQ